MRNDDTEVHKLTIELNMRAAREAALRREHDEVRAYAELSRALLRRIYAWDMMDSASDGPYWRKEIDTVLAGDHPGEVCKEDGRMHLDWCLSLNGEKCNCVPETGKKPMQEAQERIQRDMATKGTARAQDVFTILGDPSKGVTVHNPEWPCRILGPEEDELRHQSCTKSAERIVAEVLLHDMQEVPLTEAECELEASRIVAALGIGNGVQSGRNLSPESLIEWAAHWVPEANRARFAEALAQELRPLEEAFQCCGAGECKTFEESCQNPANYPVGITFTAAERDGLDRYRTGLRELQEPVRHDGLSRAIKKILEAVDQRTEECVHQVGTKPDLAPLLRRAADALDTEGICDDLVIEINAALAERQA